MSFDVPSGKITPQQSIILNRTKEVLPSTSDVANAQDIALLEYAERSKENLIAQLEQESSEDLSLCELLCLDKQLRSIRGSLKVEVSKKVQLEHHIDQEVQLEEFRDYLRVYTDGNEKESRSTLTIRMTT